MNKVLKIAFLLAFALIASAKSFAQNNITATLLEAGTEEPVGYATASLTPEGSETVYKYATSNTKGVVTIESVRDGNYTFKVELMGYKTVTKEVTVKGAALNLGNIILEEDAEVLDAASVSDMANPIIVKKDTVEYNASSFLTTDNDMLQNLLSKLPGIEVGSDGSITANGENVTRIYIDGKTFFMDDPQLASQNIPAKMVEKVKVIKKKSEQAEFSGVDDGQEETVIDLSVQPSMMNGIFANVMLGGGHDFKGEKISADVAAQDKLGALAANDAFRFQSNAMIGNFKSNSQISLILNASNAGFGGMGGRGGGGGGFGGGGMGGGMGGGGLTTNWMAGLNGAFDLLDNKMELSSNYNYNGSNSLSGSMSTSYVTQTDGSQVTNWTNSAGTNNNNGHTIGVRLQHKFSDAANIIFEPQIRFNKTNSVSSQLNSSEHSLRGLTNDGWSSSLSDGNSINASGRLVYRQRILIPGRTLTATLNWNYGTNNSESFTQSLTNMYTGGTSFANPINQRNENLSTNASAGARLEYVEPMGNNFYLSGNYSYNWSMSNTSKDTYNSGAYDVSSFSLDNLIYNRTGEVYDAVYSNKIYNKNIQQQIGANVMYQSEGMHAQVGASLMPRNIVNETNGKKYEDNAMNWAPNASIRADLGENANIRINYSGRSNQPSTNQLMPVMDNSNPTRMSLGNPYLTSYFNHNFRTEIGYTDRTTFFTTRLSANGGLNQSPIVNATWMDQASVQYSFPINASPSWNGSLSWMINTPIAKSNFRINNNLSMNYSESHSYIGVASINMDPYFNADKEFDYELFHNDYFGDNPTKNFNDYFKDNKNQNLSFNENLRLTYRSDYFEATIGGRTRVSMPKSTYESLNSSPTTWNNAVSLNITWNEPNTGLGLTADGTYNWYIGYTTNQPANFIINTEITKLIFNNNATLAIRGYDLLNQTKSFNESISGNRRTESRTLTLGRYVIVSLTFRFGTFGNGRGGRGGGRGGRGGGMPGGMPMGGGMGGGMPMGGPPMGGGMPGGGGRPF
ncbi:MAG: outer membrane beta-barrel protein [Bacteroidales bacterium]|nr:outer membrane beta-barrel protein [Bacteroidales bacterium]